MLFSSLEFLFLYLPVTLLIYFIVPSRFRNLVLLVFSLIFYGWGEPVYVFLMIATVAADYFFGFFVGKYRETGNTKKARAVLVVSIIFNLGILGFFKYLDFFAETLALLPFLSFIKPIGINLPIGISFYTFQALSYVIDVYRGDAKKQKSILNFGTYVALFPQLIAGPIVRYKDIDEQLTQRTHSVTLAASGIRTFMCGLCKKVLLANTAGQLWDDIAAVPTAERTVLLAWFGILCFTAQIYFDFSGYSDMAIGLGKILGFRFLENFNYPYIAKSITDFWRRWHISLSSWFREYVYIPLGGNRCKPARVYFNLLVVWFLTGFWHGASINYIVWGLYYFVLLVIEKAFLQKKLLDRLPAFVGNIYTLFFVVIGWLIFKFEDSADGLLYLGTMIGVGGAGLASGADLYEIVRNAVFGVIAVIACTPYPKRLFYSLFEKKRAVVYAAAVASLIGLAVCTAYLVDSSFNPFLYTRF